MSKQIGAKRKYDEVTLGHAINAVRSNVMSLRAASRSYGIPRATLFDKVTGRTSLVPSSKTVLKPAEEERLVTWIIHMARIGFGRTRQEVLDTVKRIVETENRPNPFKNNRPGKDWWYGFTKRHPELSERLPQQLGKERAIITQDKVNKWFSDLQDYIVNELKEPALLNDPSRMYNADESGFSLCPKSGKVIARKGSSNVYNFTASDKTQITVLACMGATGHYITPLIVYPGQRFSYNPLEGFQEAVMGHTENGWMDALLFVTWLEETFVPAINERGVKKPVLLFVDGHSTHMSLAVSDVCRQNGIELYCLLEHASHVMQPCDLRLFSVLKDNWRQAVRDFQYQNIGENVTKRNFASVFRQAWERSTSLSVAIHGFLDAGLFPLNPSKVLGTLKMEPSHIFQSVTSSNSTNDDVMDTSQGTVNVSPGTVNVSQGIVEGSRGTVPVSQGTVPVGQGTVPGSRETVDVSQSTATVSQGAVGVCQETVCVSQGTVDISQGAVDVSQGTVPVSQGTVVVSQGTAQLSRGTVPVSQGTVDVSQSTATVSQGAAGVSLDTVDVCQGTVDISQGTVDVSQGTVPVSQGTVVVSQGTVPLSRGTVAVSQGTVDVSQSTATVSQGAAGVSLDTVGVCQGTVDISQRTVPSSQDTVDISQGTVLVSQGAVGGSQETVIVSQETVVVSQSTVAVSQVAVNVTNVDKRCVVPSASGDVLSATSSKELLIQNLSGKESEATIHATGDASITSGKCYLIPTSSVSQAVSTILTIPKANISRKSFIKREKIPKAITGTKFREMMLEKQKKKEKELEEKNERKRQREFKKRQKELDQKVKLEKREAKQKEREEMKRKKLIEKKIKELEKRKQKADSSDESDEMPNLTDGTDSEMEVDVSVCHVCQEKYDPFDAPFWIRCCKCFARLHKKYVKSIDLCYMTEDEIEALQFECDFC